MSQSQITGQTLAPKDRDTRTKESKKKKISKQEAHANKNTIRPNKNAPVFRVTRPYLNLLTKPIFYNFIHFERRNAFQNA